MSGEEGFGGEDFSSKDEAESLASVVGEDILLGVKKEMRRGEGWVTVVSASTK